MWNLSLKILYSVPIQPNSKKKILFPSPLGKTSIRLYPNLENGPDSFNKHVSFALQYFLTHGQVTLFLFLGVTIAVETISYFRRKGFDVFTSRMDVTKAFDLFRHHVFSKKLISAGMFMIFVMILMLIYINQVANLRWNGIFLSFF